METAGGGWTVIQRHISDTDFYKTWQEYKTGFGDLNTNFWLGNDKIHLFTGKLRVDLTAPDGETGYAEYNTFSLGNESSRYQLHAVGYDGTVGDGLTYHSGIQFSTPDNDVSRSNCSIRFHGSCWYTNLGCHKVNLNGLFKSSEWGVGLNWGPWKSFYVSMTKSEMKVRRESP